MSSKPPANLGAQDQPPRRPGRLIVIGLAVVFAGYNVIALVIGGLFLASSLPKILNLVSDDWGLAFFMIFGGIGALFNLALVLPAQAIFAIVAKSLNVWLRVAILLALIVAIVVGAAPAALRDLICYSHYGSFPADAGFGWWIALGSLPVSTIAIFLGYLLSRMYRKSLQDEASRVMNGGR